MGQDAPFDCSGGGDGFAHLRTHSIIISSGISMFRPPEQDILLRIYAEITLHVSQRKLYDAEIQQ
jgi:hypothetical protein